VSLLLGPRRIERRTDRPTGSIGELLRRREPPVDAGVHVNAAAANRHSAVYACRDLIARQISTLPVHEFRRDPDTNTLVRMPTSPFLESPDGNLDYCAWAYQVLDSLLLHGNAYGLVQAVGPTGWPTQIETIHPTDVTVSRKGKRGPVQWWLDGTPIDLWPNGQLWHMPGTTVAGSPLGMSVIVSAALTISVGLAAQRFGAQWFRDGAIPTSVLTNDKEVTKTAADVFKERWLDALNNNREPIVLGNGWKHESVGIAPNESQFLQTIQANIVDVARFFGVDPTDIGAGVPGASLTYQNVEMKQINLLVRTVGPWVVRLEKALTRLRPRPRIVKHNVDAMLRMDTLTRYKAYDMAVRDGWMSVNEVRDLDDRAGIGEEGDRYLWPPMRQQLDEPEAMLGADSDPLDQPLPDQQPLTVGANGQSGDA